MKIFQNLIGQDVKIFGDILEDEALAQIQRLADFKPYQDSHIRIMPDVHAGKGCTIGTTMYITDAVTPNLVGVDIGCGMFVVPLGQVDIDLAKFDEVVHQYIPSGHNIHNTPIPRCSCMSVLSKDDRIVM
ncbi:RtcB family protein [Palleniella muris]|uniref:RtcB family protein n=1 Tax=Palleniella muris TaxID=3038145 RepID=UPI00240F1F88|nr:RtcB family protein [Palleniella muris]